MQITTGRSVKPTINDCNRLSPKCKSQRPRPRKNLPHIVTDYRLNANHNRDFSLVIVLWIVTDYRLNANHNFVFVFHFHFPIVTDYRLNANHNLAP